MLRLLADENFDGAVVRGVLRQNPGVDLIRVQDAGLGGADEPTILAWAAGEDRVLLTHDVTTMTKYAYERLAAGWQMPGIFVVPQETPVGMAIEGVLLWAEASEPDEWIGQVRYLTP